MTFVTRYTIQRLTDRNATEYYMNADQWSDDAEDAEEFATNAKAQRRADRVGGGVFSFDRKAKAFEIALMKRPAPFRHSIAA